MLPGACNVTPPSRKTNPRFRSLQVTRSRSEEHTSELQSRLHLVCRLLLEKKNKLHRKRPQLGGCAMLRQDTLTLSPGLDYLMPANAVGARVARDHVRDRTPGHVWPHANVA